MSCILRTSFSLGYKLYRDFQEKKRKICICVEERFKADIRSYITKSHPDYIIFDLDLDIVKYLKQEDRPKLQVDEAFTTFIKIKMINLIYYNFVSQAKKIIFLTSSPAVAKAFKTFSYFIPDTIYLTENNSVQLSPVFRDVDVEGRMQRRIQKKIVKFSSTQSLLEAVKNLIS
jgi:hypothetical protein